jgi:hypothetical protein
MTVRQKGPSAAGGSYEAELLDGGGVVGAGEDRFEGEDLGDEEVDVFTFGAHDDRGDGGVNAVEVGDEVVEAGADDAGFIGELLDAAAEGGIQAVGKVRVGGRPLQDSLTGPRMGTKGPSK